MKTKWSSKVPEESGWYWVKYKEKRGIVVFPVKLFLYEDGDSVIWTGRYDFLRCERLDGLKFGPEISFPS
jgi:hypothetical protein